MALIEHNDGRTIHTLGAPCRACAFEAARKRRAARSVAHRELRRAAKALEAAARLVEEDLGLHNAASALRMMAGDARELSASLGERRTG